MRVIQIEIGSQRHQNASHRAPAIRAPPDNSTHQTDADKCGYRLHQQEGIEHLLYEKDGIHYRQQNGSEPAEATCPKIMAVGFRRCQPSPVKTLSEQCSAV